MSRLFLRRGSSLGIWGPRGGYRHVGRRTYPQTICESPFEEMLFSLRRMPGDGIVKLQVNYLTRRRAT